MNMSAAAITLLLCLTCAPPGVEAGKTSLLLSSGKKAVRSGRLQRALLVRPGKKQQGANGFSRSSVRGGKKKGPHKTRKPTAAPSAAPSSRPSSAPSSLPSSAPSSLPSDAPSQVPSLSPSPTGVPSGTVTFNYTGSSQHFVVPPGVLSIDIAAWGGQGGVNNGTTQLSEGGLGGFAFGTLSVTPREVLQINVGGSGNVGGFNGGGPRGLSDCPISVGGTGGGASDIRQGGTNLTDRVIVAGGGGGAGGDRNFRCAAGAGGGGGGGYYGGGGGGGWQGAGGGGGSQISGGVRGIGRFGGGHGAFGEFGSGGNGGSSPSSLQAGANSGPDGGAGGGLVGFRGLHGSPGFRGGGGGGGSSFLHPALVSNNSTIAGVRLGNGLIEIVFPGGGQMQQVPSAIVSPVQESQLDRQAAPTETLDEEEPQCDIAENGEIICDEDLVEEILPACREICQSL